jgi:hypothetical protein
MSDEILGVHDWVPGPHNWVSEDGHRMPESVASKLLGCAGLVLAAGITLALLMVMVKWVLL